MLLLLLQVFLLKVGVTQTCVMSAVHSSMMVAHGIQIVQEVGGSQVRSSGLFPAGLQRGRVGAVVAFDHVRRHVQARQGEMHKGGEFVPPLPYLPEALQVEDEDVRERPQAHLHHALLQLLTVGALPCVIRGELMQEREVKIKIKIMPKFSE